MTQIIKLKEILYESSTCILVYDAEIKKYSIAKYVKYQNITLFQ